MSYVNIGDDKFVEDTLSRKEFYSLKAANDRNFRDPGEDDTFPAHLKISSYQLFVGNFINPNTPYKRLHLKFMTGGGKTLGALYSAHKFIEKYRKMHAVAVSKIQATRRNLQELDRELPTVFVLGFEGTKNAFLRDLMKYPEFGFITLSEKEELLKRQNLANSGMPDDVRYYREYYAVIKKRITNKAKGGFFKFFGYDEFVNRLFYSETIALTDLETIVANEIKAGRETTLEAVFADHIKRGIVQVNTTLMDMFKNSLLICDEIHNTYNMNMKNNRGVAIQYILDSIPSLRFLSLSATPINNSPTEVVEWINYLVPADQKVTKRELFSGRNLLPGKLEFIGKLLRGRVSFLQDVNIKYFPKSEFVGSEIKIPHDVGDIGIAGASIPYLKFVDCPMSEFHQATLLEYQKNPSNYVGDENTVSEHTVSEHTVSEHTVSEKENTEESDFSLDDAVVESSLDAENLEPEGEKAYPAIPTDGYSIYDIAFPNPDSTKYGMFRSGEVRGKLLGATQEWRDKNQIYVKKYSALNYAITGEFLEESNIKKYSTKYHTVLKILNSLFDSANNDPNMCQKVMIYHDRVKMSGVLLIQELLLANGYIDEFMSPIDSTRCQICGEVLSRHGVNHEYQPARFVIAHSDIDKAIMNQSLVKFNAPSNAHGNNFMILVGSKIVKESYDFKDIQNLILTSLPVNIPTFLQVIGRCIRKASHINLPPDQRRVRIHILMSTVNKNVVYTDEISPEMYRYIDKLADYIIIQNIEREIIRNAIDADLNRDIIMPPDLRAQYFPDPNGKPIDMLGNLYFEPAFSVKTVQPTLTTFITGRYFEEEIRLICFIIKRLFMIRSVWTYEQLWDSVRKPPFGVEVNPALFAENNFIIALENLVKKTASIISSRQTTQSMLLEKMFDYNDRYIYISGQKSQVEKIGKYYIAFPVVTTEVSSLNEVTEYKEIVRDKERALIKTGVGIRENPLIDIETYVRHTVPDRGVMINVENYIADNRANTAYLSKRAAFIKTSYTGDELTVHFLSHYTDRFQIAFVEEAIAAIVNGALISVSDPVTNGKHERVDDADMDITKSITDDKIRDAAITQLYEKILDIMNKFRVLTTIGEIKKYKDTAKQYKNGIPDIDPSIPIGYATSRFIRLYDPSEMRWFEVSKIALNRQIRYKENEVIIGYFETVEDDMKFKLRSPVQKIDVKKSTKGNVTTKDTRLIERGIVCTTKNKSELLSVISKLGVSMSKLDRSELRIKKLCGIIMRHLIERELRERGKDTKYKFLYSWWDEMPDLTKIE